MKTWLAWLLIGLPLGARADIADDIKRQLTPFVVMRGDFQQVKNIKIIKKSPQFPCFMNIVCRKNNFGHLELGTRN